MAKTPVEKRERGALPRAFLRVDPNIDQIHEQPAEMLRLLCAANRQQLRGRFKNRTAFQKIFGASAAKRAIERGDVVDHAAAEDCAPCPEHERLCDPMGWPHLYVQWWDEWQESDLDVGTRMRRLRGRERTARWRQRRAEKEASPSASQHRGVTPSRDAHGDAA